VFLKKLHTLTIKAFLPPFIVTLFTSVFLLFLVQIVITYLDDLLGKGLKTIDLLTLFTYAWIAIVPQCIPLAVLLGSIMSFGNLAENYELAAMKSSGLSLFRIIKAVFVVILILAVLTFLFNNFILPVVHLKSQSLLYDIRNKKPTFAVQEGIFYNKIENYTLYVGKKSKNKDTVHDIYIYDHSAHQGNKIQLYAKTGKFATTADTNALVVTLRDGNRYEEITDLTSPNTTKQLSQLNFKQLQVNIQLDNKLKRTNEELFKGSEEMMNIWQLDSISDTIIKKINGREQDIQRQASSVFYSRTNAVEMAALKIPTVNVRQFYDSLTKAQFDTGIQNALNISRTASGNIDAMEVSINADRDTALRLLIEWHRKIVVSFACIVLFFVGAPLGAIIKKGGLGLPVIVSVFFFLTYYILSEIFVSFAVEGSMAPWLALWMPLLIFLPVSIFLTLKAANDSVIFDATIYYTWINKLFKRTKSA
jgi:lipopolysaccharide export system permease protein